MRPSWDIVGGRIHPGTPPLENLKREIKEDVDLNFDGAAQLVAAQDILKNNGRHVVRLTFTGELDGRPKLSEEHLEAKWLSADEIKAMPTEIFDSYLRELLDSGKIIL